MTHTVHLGKKGYVSAETNPSEVLTVEFAHMFESDYSQSTIWHGNVASIQWVLKEYGHQPDRVVIELQGMISRVYEAHNFDRTVVEVTLSTDDYPDGQYGVDVYAQATMNGNTYKLYRGLFVDPDEETINVVKKINS